MPNFARLLASKGFRLISLGLVLLLLIFTLSVIPVIQASTASYLGIRAIASNSGPENFAPTISVEDIAFSKTFAPNTIGPGSVATLQFDIVNFNQVEPVANLAFTDTLPAGVTIASPANIVTTCPDSAVLAPNGGDTIIFSGDRLGASSSCFITVDVTSNALGTHTNVSGDLTSSAGNNGSAVADLTVAANLPGFTKSFSPDSISSGGRSTLTFLIDNTANEVLVTGLSFVDMLPTGMTIAEPVNAANTCLGTLTAVSGTAVINFSGGALFSGTTCTISVDVNGVGADPLGNTTGELTSAAGSSGKASAVLNVTTDALALTKSFTDDPVPPGYTTSLEFTIHNMDRLNSATNIAFTDDLDATLSGLVAVGLPLNNPCGAGSQLTGTSLLSLNGGSLPPEGSCTFNVILQTPGAAAISVYPNTTSSITGDVGGSPAIGSPATDWLFVQPVPILAKEFINDPIGTGDTVTITFAITNSSLISDATNIAFGDEFTTFFPFPVTASLPTTPCGGGSTVTLISFGTERQGIALAGGSLGPGASCTFDVGLAVPAGVAPGTYTNTTEPITAVIGSATYTGNPASDDLVVVGAPRLLKEFIDDPVLPGSSVTLEFTLTNEDTTQNATGIAFSDDLNATLAGLSAVGLPANDICGAGSQINGTTNLTLTGASLDPSATCTFSVTLQVPNAALPGKFTNTTSNVTATIGGLAVTGNPAQDELEIAGITFTKTFADDPVIIPGETVTLRFTIENTSPTANVASMIFTDNLDAALTGLVAVAPLPTEPCGAGSALSGTNFLIFTGGNLAPLSSCTFDVTVQVPGGSASGTYINTTSNLTASVDGSGVILDPATDTLTISSDMVLLSKSFTDDPAAPGDTVTLEFTITNAHTTKSVTGITFTDDLNAVLSGLAAAGLPANDICGAGSQISGTSLLTLTGGNLGPGASCTFSVSLQIPVNAAVGAHANTTSSATGTIGGLPVTGDPAKDDLNISVLAFTKSFDGPATATGAVSLTFTIENLDSGLGASSIAFTDDLDAVITGLAATGLPKNDVCGVGSILSGTTFITLTGGDLAPGGSCTFSVLLQVPAMAAAGTFTNTTSDLTSSGLKVSDPATAVLTIEPPPSFSKSFAPNPIIEGNISTLSFTIDNTASALAASSLAFTDNLPAGMTIASPANASTTCTGGVLTAVSGTGIISYSGGTVNAGASCMVQADVTSNVPGAHVNTTGDLTSSSGNSGTASDTLTVNSKNILAINDISVSETVGTATFTVTLSAASISDVTVDFATSDGTAVQPDDYLAASGTVTITAGSTTSDISVTIVDDALGEPMETFSVTLSAPTNATIGDSEGVGTIIDDETSIYLPLVMRDFTPGPDLVVTSLNISSGNAQVVIENQGNQPVLDEFWVDVYIDPTPAPTTVNQTWAQLSDEGLVWGVTSGALPLAPGASLTLTLNDAHYRADLSVFTGTILPGTAVYAQVDSADSNTTYGAVFEIDEKSSVPYNNIWGTTAAAAPTAMPFINWLDFPTDFVAQYPLPERP